MLDHTTKHGTAAALIDITPQPAASDDWDALSARIRLLAMRRAEGLLAFEIDSDEEFDRGARALRSLMSAAEIIRRIRLSEQKDDAAHDESAQQAGLSDEDIRAIYRDVAGRIDRIEREEAGGDQGSAPAHYRSAGGENMGADRP